MTHFPDGLAQITSFVKGIAGRTQTLPGIAIGDKIVGATRFRIATGTAGTIASIATLTAAQFSVSAANYIYKKGTPSSFPNFLVAITWVDKDLNI
jgi:hypothetical protein